MLNHQEIDDVLAQAQSAVDTLASDVGGLAGAGLAHAAEPPDARRVTRPAEIRTGPASRIVKLRVPVVVRVAQRPMVLSEILKLAPGMILEFDRPVESELDLLVNNHPIGAGLAVKVNERFGLRISRIGPLAQRVHSLGTPPHDRL